jgi:hypothetical protein
MADLIDRISGVELHGLNLHAWIGAQRLYASGLKTRIQIADAFDITGHVDEARQATQIADVIDGAGNATSRMIKILQIEAILMCVEDSRDRLYHDANGNLIKSTVFSDLQIVG